MKGSPYLGTIHESVCDISVRIMSSAPHMFYAVFNLEVKIMITTIIMICLAAGTALLGRSGDMFPKLGEKAYAIMESTY